MALIRSSRASSVLNRFHGAKAIVYVEGERDEAFWSHFGESYGIRPKSAGSKSACLEHAQKLIETNERFLVAVDSDYDDFSSSKIDDPRVIYTYGYSIENLVCSCKAIARYLNLKGGGVRIRESEVKEVASRWFEQIKNLIYIDVFMHISKQGKKGPFAREHLQVFCETGLSDVEIKKIENGMLRALNKADFLKWKNEVKLTKHHVKGKFVLCLVNQMATRVFGQKKSSNDDLFAGMAALFPTQIQSKGHNIFRKQTVEALKRVVIPSAGGKKKG
ncbi:DUF4435 domain-containing protein [Pelagicoccus sp. SDUM812002]|uniref:DUF4435 domain-containing protein n=1 Tax=Pelagicoccus sp. SDUM812002 TaxID=3041266 RepID=UPI00280D9FA9|nr:DUF4435 domain-containing protein [Pelagicoccus sp. SDUM812002]MDQ8186954.1 DUF4435 domain-containing protein [Pelagicoccus sp. SDUM812002]